MEKRNRLTVTKGMRGEGSSQRTGINDPWAWTTAWGLIVGAGSGWGRAEQYGKNWDNCYRMTIKNKSKNKK